MTFRSENIAMINKKKKKLILMTSKFFMKLLTSSSGIINTNYFLRLHQLNDNIDLDFQPDFLYCLKLIYSPEFTT